MQKHVYSMFPVLSSPLNHTQKNQNKVMPLTYRTEFENKIKIVEKEKTTHSNFFYGNQNIGIKYIHSYSHYQPVNSINNINTIKTRTLTTLDNNGTRNINKNLGWGGNRFFSLSTMRNGGCGCG